ITYFEKGGSHRAARYHGTLVGAGSPVVCWPPGGTVGQSVTASTSWHLRKRLGAFPGTLLWIALLTLRSHGGASVCCRPGQFPYPSANDQFGSRS
ncbi:MAG TPA: hypothetical protein VIV60_17540, partial [Polyangiaceae bacterium]